MIGRTLALAAALTALVASDAAACQLQEREIRGGYRTEVSCGPTTGDIYRRGTLVRERGTRYTDVARADGWVALASIRARGDRRDRIVELLTWPGDRRVWRRVQRGDETPRRLPEVELTGRRALAYAVDGHIRVRRAGGATRTITPANGTRLEVDRDGTLLWRGAGALHSRDLERLPLGSDGCPRRSRSAIVLDTPTVLVTRRVETRRTRGFDRTLVRLCVKGGGRDVLAYAAQTEDHDDVLPTAEPIGVSGPFVLLATRTTGGRGEPAPCAALWIADARSGRTVRALDFGAAGTPEPPDGACPQDALTPRRGDPLAITQTGAPAWLRDGVLRALTRDERLVELDRGPITDLAADGPVVTWKNGVDPRSARP